MNAAIAIWLAGCAGFLLGCGWTYVVGLAGDRAQEREIEALKSDNAELMATANELLNGARRAASTHTLSDHGSYEDAVEFTLRDPAPADETATFLCCWREGNLSDWPEFYAWLDARRAAS